MKKLLSLFVLLVAIVTGAKADVTYKDFTAATTYEFTAENVTAAQTAGWLASGTTASTRKLTTDPFTGETVSETSYPGLNVKAGNSKKTCKIYVKGVNGITIYCVNHNASGRKVWVTATPTEGEAVSNSGEEGGNPYTVVLTLDATKEYMIEAVGGSATSATSGNDCTVFGFSVTVPDSGKEPSTFGLTSATSVTLWKGETSTITYENNAGTVAFGSSSDAVATVSAVGVITAVAEGTATITVTDPGSDAVDGAEKTVTVTVKEHKNTSTENIEAADGSSILDNSGSISSDSYTLSFDDEPMVIVGTGSFQAGSNNYKFTVDENDYTAVKVAKNGTYTLKPNAGYTITSVIAYASSNSSSTSQISSGENSLDLAARGTSGEPVAPTPFTLSTNADGEYYFTIGGSASQAIVVLKVAYTSAKQMLVTIKETGYATLYTDYAVTIPENVNAYTAKFNSDKSAVVLKKVNTTIPANTAVILNTETPGEYSFEAAEDVAAIAGNVLEGTLVDTDVEASTVYTLGLGSNGKVGMRNYTGTSLRAYSAFITKSTNDINTLNITFEDVATAVDAIAEANKAEVAPVKVIKNGKLYIGNYNVAGQQVK